MQFKPISFPSLPLKQLSSKHKLYAVILYYRPDCVAHLHSIGKATWTICAATKKNIHDDMKTHSYCSCQNVFVMIFGNFQRFKIQSEDDHKHIRIIYQVKVKAYLLFVSRFEVPSVCHD